MLPLLLCCLSPLLHLLHAVAVSPLYTYTGIYQQDDVAAYCRSPNPSALNCSCLPPSVPLVHVRVSSSRNHLRQATRVHAWSFADTRVRSSVLRWLRRCRPRIRSLEYTNQTTAHPPTAWPRTQHLTTANATAQCVPLAACKPYCIVPAAKAADNFIV